MLSPVLKKGRTLKLTLPKLAATTAVAFSMNEKTFLDAIRQYPHQDAPRLVFADWLEEQEEHERAEFIRLQIKLAKEPTPVFPLVLGTRYGNLVHVEAREPELAIRQPHQINVANMPTLKLTNRYYRGQLGYYTMKNPKYSSFNSMLVSIDGDASSFVKGRAPFDIYSNSQRMLLTGENWRWWSGLPHEYRWFVDQIEYRRGLPYLVKLYCRQVAALLPYLLNYCPIQEVRLVDRAPEGTYVNTPNWRWYRGDAASNRELSYLPEYIYKYLVGYEEVEAGYKEYTTWYAAVKAASDACLMSVSQARTLTPAVYPPISGR